MGKLNVNDFVYLEYFDKWSSIKRYKKGIVTRLTKTRAILNDGTQLINNPQKYRGEVNFHFCQYGDSWSKWRLITNEMHDVINQYEEDEKIKNWWYSKKDNLTLQEIKIIHNALK